MRAQSVISLVFLMLAVCSHRILKKKQFKILGKIRDQILNKGAWNKHPKCSNETSNPFPIMTDDLFDSSESLQERIPDAENFKLAARALRDHNVRSKDLFIMRVTELIYAKTLRKEKAKKLKIQAQPTICTSDKVEMKLPQIYTNSCIVIPICYRCKFLVNIGEVKLINGTCDRMKIEKKKKDRKTSLIM